MSQRDMNDKVFLIRLSAVVDSPSRKYAEDILNKILELTTGCSAARFDLEETTLKEAETKFNGFSESEAWDLGLFNEEVDEEEEETSESTDKPAGLVLDTNIEVGLRDLYGDYYTQWIDTLSSFANAHAEELREYLKYRD